LIFYKITNVGCLYGHMFGEGIGSFADDDMIEGPHLYDIQGFLDPRKREPFRAEFLNPSGRTLLRAGLYSSSPFLITSLA
jgi:hypothetical protein